MREEHLELARRLFVEATEIAEIALDHALLGQAPDLDGRRALALAEQLVRDARELGSLAGALEVIAGRAAGS